MPDWAINLVIATAGLLGSLALVGVAWGTLNERVANLKEQLKEKASNESVEHMSRSLDEIKALVSELVEKIPKPRGGKR
jgi:hypothetical protein